MTIWKFPISLAAKEIQVPEGSQFLSVQVQNNQIVAWFAVHETWPKTAYAINVVATGQQEDTFHRSQFLGTVQLDNGALVFHIFHPLY